MRLSDKTKTLLWIVFSIVAYYGGLFVLISHGVDKWRSNSIGGILIILILYLVGFPFVQYFAGKSLKSTGNLPAAAGLHSSILIEIILLVVLILILSNLS